MGQTRCKVRCQSVTKKIGWEKREDGTVGYLYAAEFTGVYGDSPENKEFFAASPSISLTVQTVREDHFEVGKDYYLDFTLAQ